MVALATVEDVISELRATKGEYGYADQLMFETWVERYINMVAARIANLVGPTNYVDTNEAIVQAEILWAVYYMLRKRQVQLTADGESGFAIGSLRINSSSTAAAGIREARTQLLQEVQSLLRPYMSVTYSRILFVPSADDIETDVDLEMQFADRMWIRHE